MEPAKALKRQDPSLIRGMATVDKELSTHLNTGKLNIFRAACWHNALARKCKIPVCVGEPLRSPAPKVCSLCAEVSLMHGLVRICADSEFPIYEDEPDLATLGLPRET